MKFEGMLLAQAAKEMGGIAEQAVGQKMQQFEEYVDFCEKYPARAKIQTTLRMPKERTQEVCFI